MKKYEQLPVQYLQGKLYNTPSGHKNNYIQVYCRVCILVSILQTFTRFLTRNNNDNIRLTYENVDA